MRDSYCKNYKILLKEIIKDLNKCKDILCSWAERLHVCTRQQTVPKFIYRFKAITVKCLSALFYINGQLDPKMHIQLQTNKQTNKRTAK